MPEVTVYALRFEAGRIYVGLAKDLERRLTEHHRRQSPSTKRLNGEFTLVYSARLASYKEARAHEVFLKSGAGRRLLLECAAFNQGRGVDRASAAENGSFPR